MRKLSGKSEFDAFLASAGGGVIACFFAEWCPHCVRYLPVLESHPEHPGIELASVDISDESDPLWEELGIDVVPSLILFLDGLVAGRVDGILGRGLGPGDIDRLLTAS